ncbi:hypothetical protein BGZ63DRAFT_96360 [Mariannaea sp. PMI_226]|nr:hypothetical protein BGZ63DRAFT_96360 [Mariannaea sp. PMI_226]
MAKLPRPRRLKPSTNFIRKRPTQPQNSEPRARHLINLPLKILVKIAENLSFSDILSFSQTCKKLSRAAKPFLLNDSTVISIFTREVTNGLGPIRENLKAAIKSPLIRNSCLEGLFAVAWEAFSALRLEELLLPYSLRIARRYRKKDQMNEATIFMKKIWNCEEPFVPSRPPLQHENYDVRWQPTLVMIGQFLLKSGEIEGQERERVKTGINRLNSSQPTLQKYFSNLVHKKYEIGEVLCSLHVVVYGHADSIHSSRAIGQLQVLVEEVLNRCELLGEGFDPSKVNLLPGWEKTHDSEFTWKGLTIKTVRKHKRNEVPKVYGQVFLKWD